MEFSSMISQSHGKLELTVGQQNMWKSYIGDTARSPYSPFAQSFRFRWSKYPVSAARSNRCSKAFIGCMSKPKTRHTVNLTLVWMDPHHDNSSHTSEAYSLHVGGSGTVGVSWHMMLPLGFGPQLPSTADSIPSVFVVSQPILWMLARVWEACEKRTRRELPATFEHRDSYKIAKSSHRVPWLLLPTVVPRGRKGIGLGHWA